MIEMVRYKVEKETTTRKKYSSDELLNQTKSFTAAMTVVFGMLAIVLLWFGSEGFDVWPSLAISAGSFSASLVIMFFIRAKSYETAEEFYVNIPEKKGGR